MNDSATSDFVRPSMHPVRVAITCAVALAVGAASIPWLAVLTGTSGTRRWVSVALLLASAVVLGVVARAAGQRAAVPLALLVTGLVALLTMLGVCWLRPMGSGADLVHEVAPWSVVFAAALLLPLFGDVTGADGWAGAVWAGVVALVLVVVSVLVLDGRVRTAEAQADRLDDLHALPGVAPYLPEFEGWEVEFYGLASGDDPAAGPQGYQLLYRGDADPFVVTVTSAGASGLACAECTTVEVDRGRLIIDARGGDPVAEVVGAEELADLEPVGWDTIARLPGYGD